MVKVAEEVCGRMKRLTAIAARAEVFTMLLYEGVRWVDRLRMRESYVEKRQKVPMEWCEAVLVALYKGKGDIHECGSHGGHSLLSTYTWKSVRQSDS